MPSITSSGIGSGLDIASLVAQLVAAERSPTQTRITQAQNKLNVQLSALGTFKGALSDVKAKLDALRSDGVLGALKATVSNPDAFTASATAAATAGRYDIEVVSLARAHKLVSAAYPGGGATVLGDGDVEISVGGESFTVTLGGGENTLADLRSKINATSDNTGVSATLINTDGGTRLLLTATRTGADHAIVVTSGLVSFTEQQAAADAHVRIEGYDHFASSNTISDAIDGVTLHLTGADPGQVHTLTLAPDDEAVTKAVSAFVNAYNAAVTTVASLTRYDAEKRSAAPLTGDGAVRSAMQNLRNVLGATVEAGSFDYLADIGITTRTDGTLVLDGGKLAAALASDRGSVERLFTAENGYAVRLATVLDEVLGADGSIGTKTEALQARLRDLDGQQQALDDRMARVQARYQAQFSALDALIAQMNSTSNFLTQQLTGLAQLNKRS
ncbi:flagellar hook-associated protein 2 [Fontimonas thermophila]|uniref:Flagellar hook-associated protein 2 n=1 Tax=Fontimonas thermophila TaxID=1076937 RepID=A0A1I2HV18_9GAMM|nr:flagellar filament capping protein FliD [Fontimonas thermophila]SFF33448.1 flagellar hook-associated protein 2 [Fontimonas thermophila]